MLSLGALTTPFTPAPSCLFTNNLWRISTSVSAINEPSMIWEQFGAPLESASGCFPPNYNPASTAYYSPAQCPSGYGPVSSSTGVSQGTTETTHVCCPTIMDFHPLTVGTTRPAQPYLSSFLCESYYPATETTMVVTSSEYGKPPFVVSITPKGGAMNAYGIVVRFQQSDFPSTTDVPLTASDAPQGAGSITTSTATAPPSSGDGGGLSTGASVGIGVSVGVAGLALIIGAIVLLLRRRKQRIMKENTVQQGEAQVYHEVPKWEPPVETPHEIDSTEHKPLGSSFAPTELEAR